MPSLPPFKLALITGASSGLGERFAHFLQEKGIELILTGRSLEPYPLNLTDPVQRLELLTLIETKKPDLIINNAGFGLYGPSICLSNKEQMELIELNVKAVVEISLVGARQMVNGGVILNISSAAAFFPFPTFNAYASSKAFVNHFSLGLDAELRPKGIRVLTACPGQIDTPFRSKAGAGVTQKKDKRTMSVEVAVSHLWKQIEKKKTIYIFDWKTKVMVFLAKMLPYRLVSSLLMATLKGRYIESDNR